MQIIAFWYRTASGNWAGHAVVPYRLDTLSSSLYRIYCYDNWSAYHDYYFEINTNTGSITYYRGYGGSPVQPVNYIDLLPSSPFTNPPIMNFYSETSHGAVSKSTVTDITNCYSGTATGIRTVRVVKTTTGKISFFSPDTYYNTGECFIVIIPADTFSGNSAPLCAFQFSPGSYKVTLTGDNVPGGKVFLTTLGRIFSVNSSSLASDDTLTLFILSTGVIKIALRNPQRLDLSILSLLDATSKNKGSYSLRFSTLSGTLEFSVQNADTTRMTLSIKRAGTTATRYAMNGIISDYSNPASPYDTIVFPDSIPIGGQESQLIETQLDGNVIACFIARDPNGDGTYEDTISHSLPVRSNNTSSHTLRLNFTPNPFSAHLVIAYELPYETSVLIEIYDILGHKVSSMFTEHTQRGWHTVSWDAPPTLPNGLYFIKLTAGGKVLTKYATLIR